VNNTLLPRPANRPARRLDFEAVTDIVLDCALESIIFAFMVQIMGSVVIGSVSWVWHDMTPSLPPVISHKPAAEAATSTSFDFSFFHAHQFAILFTVIFIGKALAQLARYSRNPDHRNAAALVLRAYRRVSDEWFSLVVVNAFTAFVGVLVLQVTQEFTLTRIIWQVIVAVCHPLIDAIVRYIPGGGIIGALVGWYNDNQFKFAFWLLYSAAICDDLGLPNYKTLCRFLWRRWFGRQVKVSEPQGP
jgi:hypothetical protein